MTPAITATRRLSIQQVAAGTSRTLCRRMRRRRGRRSSSSPCCRTCWRRLRCEVSAQQAGRTARRAVASEIPAAWGSWCRRPAAHQHSSTMRWATASGSATADRPPFCRRVAGTARSGRTAPRADRRRPGELGEVVDRPLDHVDAEAHPRQHVVELTDDRLDLERWLAGRRRAKARSSCGKSSTKSRRSATHSAVTVTLVPVTGSSTVDRRAARRTSGGAPGRTGRPCCRRSCRGSRATRPPGGRRRPSACGGSRDD